MDGCMDGWMKSQYNLIVDETNNTTMDGWIDEISIQLDCG
jgi:hypothetical protein